MLRFTNVTFFVLAVICSILILPCIGHSLIGAEWNPTGDPIGGGPGYSDSVRHQDSDYYVVTKAQLLSALINASSGDIIYVADSAEIEVDYPDYVLIPAGVTLASGRGRTLGDTVSWGGLIYCTEFLRVGGRPLIKAGGKRVRITGLRLRGGFSPLEGQQLESDSFPQPLPSCYYGIEIGKDSAEADNCEIWGFSGAPIYVNDCSEIDIHHNYFHDHQYTYHGYGPNFAVCPEYRSIANFTDYGTNLLMSGGGPSMVTRGYHAWCIFGHHTFGSSFSCHRADPYDSSAWDSISNCSFYTTGYTYNSKSGYNLRHPARDTTIVYNAWFKNDSAKSIGIDPSAAAKLIDNWYSPTPPSGVESRIPIAAISCDNDSGSAPLTVTFSATGSYDQDGEIIAYYWNFGDSLKPENYTRHTDNRSVSHTYNRIGKYLVELMVVDNHGIMNYAYKTINVAPSDNGAWISCWIKDRNYDSVTGYFKKQILLDNLVCWEKDIAGNGSWEHIIIDVDDLLTGKDSVTLAFRLLCTKDTSFYYAPTMYVDDIVIYGANVINGDFETGTWTGNVYTRTDGYWHGSSYGTAYLQAIEFEMDVHSGKRSFYLGTIYHNNNHQGDWGKVAQRLDVVSVGILSHEESKVCSLGCPYPNPAFHSSNIRYSLRAQSNLSVNFYDVSGRLVKSLVRKEQTPGEYTVSWDGTDNRGRTVPGGVYFCNFVASDFEETKQIVWLR